MNIEMKIRSVARTRLALALLFGACFSGALAVPTVPQVVAGQATFTQQGNVFSITNTPNTVINWQSFSVNAGDVTRFIQQSGDSAVLNRILGQDPSKILGALQSNGHVFLINPNGIVFGRDSRVDVNGLTASTLNLSNADFLAGRNSFKAGMQAGAVVNQGQITTPAGGKVFLIAPDATNSGVITSPGGQVVLAAGHTVQLVDSSNPDLHVVVSAPANGALNLGQVIAQGGQIGIYGALVSQRGSVNADSAHVGANGKIVLRASADAMLEAGSVTSATGVAKGGQVSVEGQRVGLVGNARIDASGATAGGVVLVGGGYQGKNALMNNAQQTLLGKDASIRADATTNGDGGTVVLWADGSTRALGQVSAQGGALSGNGGLVETSGRYLDVSGIRVNAGARNHVNGAIGANGANGTWLLDPLNIDVITSGSATLGSIDDFADVSEGTARIDPATINSVASGTNVVLQATGNVTISSPIAATLGSGSLTIDAGNDINVNASIASGGAAVTLTANHPSYASGAGAVNINAPVTTAGGKLTMKGGAINVAALANAGAGDMALVASGAGLVVGTSGGLRSNGMIDIRSDRVSLPGALPVASAGGALPNIAFNPFSKDYGIDVVVGDSGGSLALDPAHLAAMHVQGVVLGGSAMNSIVKVSSPYSGGTAGSLTIATQGAIYIGAPVTLPTGSTLLLDIGGTTPNSSITLKGALKADSIALRANNMTVGAPVTGNSASGIITLKPHLASSAILLGAGALDSADGTLGLDDAELAFLSAYQVKIGDAGSNGPVTVTGLANFSGLLAGSMLNLGSGDANLTLNGVLKTPGALMLAGRDMQTASSAYAQASSINLSSTFGAGTAVMPFNTRTSFLAAANNSISGQAPINLSNSGALTLGSIHQNGSGNQGDITVVNDNAVMVGVGQSLVTGGNGAVRLKSIGALTMDGAIGTQAGLTAVEAGNGGVLTLGASAKLTSVSGNIGLTAGDIVNHGSVAAGTGAVTLSAKTVTGAGTFTGTGGVTGLPVVPVVPAGPTLTACLADASIAGCGLILDTVLDACMVDPSGVNCSAVLPQLSVCVATPAVKGCSVVLPSLTICIADKSTPGCTAVLPSLVTCVATPTAPGCTKVLPTIAICVANPGAAGCSVVLPTLVTCVANPTAPGCNVVLPTLATCVVTPAASGCSAVLPTMSACVADPAASGCSIVLPAFTTCIATPTAAGCSVVLPPIGTCVATPAAPGCAVVLPTITACVANPAAAGCSVVLPTIGACIANPTAPGCGVVLPSLATCIGSPAAAGCVAVLPTIAACSVNPAATGCTVVLTTLASCVAVPVAPGCAAVLPAVVTCLANPTAAGCSVVLPTTATCIAAPAVQGCAVVLPSIAVCVANPAVAACSVVLPPLAMCIGTPGAPGCGVVLPPLATCIAAPALPGCAVVLPTLSTCVADPVSAGCTVVLPSLARCIAGPASVGCNVVLPSLSQCSVMPGAAGCAVVLPSLNQCAASPALVGCNAVLPTVAMCVAGPARVGCSVVLPTLSQCSGNPSVPGCTVVLPTLSQCVGSPSLQGCAAVLPPVSTCVANPAVPGCSVIAPPRQPAPDSALTPVASATVQVINASTIKVLPPGGQGKLDETKDSEKASDATAVKLPGDQQDVRKKTYCN